MAVELRPHVGTGVISRKPRQYSQWYVIHNGWHVGYLSTNPGSGICYIEKLDDKQKEEIEADVRSQLDREIGNSSDPPVIPVGFKLDMEEDEDGDFDS